MEDACIGLIIGFAGNYAPAGWAICDGSELSIAEYGALYSLIGVTYGGDGVNTFRLPNLMNMVPIGDGQAPGLTPRSMGQFGGSNTVMLQAENLPAHTHAFNVSQNVGTQSTPTANSTLSALDNTNVTFYDDASGATLSNLNAVSVSLSTGMGAAHANQMPFQEITYIICLDGMYPMSDAD